MKRQCGLSLIELLVGMTISLFLIIAIVGSAQFINIQRGITINANNVLENLTFAYYEVSSTIKSSGSGITDCNMLSFSSGNTFNSIPLYSQAIITNNDNGSDTITTNYGDSDTGGAYSFLLSDISQTANFTGYHLNSGYSGHLAKGGLLLISYNGNCSLAAISKIEYSETNNTSSIETGALYKGVKLDLTTNIFEPFVTNIRGLSSFKSITYSIVDGTLQESDSISGSKDKVADNIILLKAYYGLTDGSFVKADNSSGKDWSISGLEGNPGQSVAIQSIRVFMLARSPLIANKGVPGQCTATTKMPVSWEGGPVVDLSNDYNWRCYKYKKIDFVVALRNKILNKGSI